MIIKIRLTFFFGFIIVLKFSIDNAPPYSRHPGQTSPNALGPDQLFETFCVMSKFALLQSQSLLKVFDFLIREIASTSGEQLRLGEVRYHQVQPPHFTVKDPMQRGDVKAQLTLTLCLQHPCMQDCVYHRRGHSYFRISQLFIGPFPSSTKIFLLITEGSNTITSSLAGPQNSPFRAGSKPPPFQPPEQRLGGPLDSTPTMSPHYHNKKREKKFPSTGMWSSGSTAPVLI